MSVGKRKGKTPNDNIHRRNALLGEVSQAVSKLYEKAVGRPCTVDFTARDDAPNSTMMLVRSGNRVWSVLYTIQLRKETVELAKETGPMIVRITEAKGSEETMYKKLMVDGLGDHYATIFAEEIEPTEEGGFPDYKVHWAQVVDLAPLRALRKRLGTPGPLLKDDKIIYVAGDLRPPFFETQAVWLYVQKLERLFESWISSPLIFATDHEATNARVSGRSLLTYV